MTIPQVRHPSPHARLGALAVVNKIYRTWRERSDLVALFGVDLLASALSALRLADGDDPALGTAAAAERAVEHLLKMIRGSIGTAGRECALMRRDEGRIAFKDGLPELFQWLWVRAAAEQTLLRRCCWRILQDLVPTAIGTPLNAWVQQQCPGSAGVRSALGGGGALRTWMVAHSGAGGAPPHAHDACIAWMARVGAAADAHVWALRSGHATAAALFSAASSSSGANRSPKKKRARGDGGCAEADDGGEVPHLLRAIATAFSLLFAVRRGATAADAIGRSAALRYEGEFFYVPLHFTRILLTN